MLNEKNTMLEGLIYCKEENIKNEFFKYFSNDTQIKAKILSREKDIENYLLEKTTWFIIFATAPEENIDSIIKIHKTYPHLYLIYYYPELNIDNFQYSDFIYFSYLIVGDKRREYLAKIFSDISQTYWKKIPFDNFGITYTKLSSRLQKVMNYIETHDIKKSSTSKLADYIRISRGYFSQEFKRETGHTFREFMQKLIGHYERIIFDRLNLTAKQASEILGYSEPSSFSRSFKKRKGYPPSVQKNQKAAEMDLH